MPRSPASQGGSPVASRTPCHHRCGAFPRELHPTACTVTAQATPNFAAKTTLCLPVSVFWGPGVAQPGASGSVSGTGCSRGVIWGCCHMKAELRMGPLRDSHVVVGGLRVLLAVGPRPRAPPRGWGREWPRQKPPLSTEPELRSDTRPVTYVLGASPTREKRLFQVPAQEVGSLDTSSPGSLCHWTGTPQTPGIPDHMGHARACQGSCSRHACPRSASQGC